MKTIYIYISFMFMFFMTLSYVRSQEINKDPLVFIVPIDGKINNDMSEYLKNSFKEACSFNSDIILLNINTYGGELKSTDKIIDLIIDSDVPVWCFISRKAVSAGSVIAMYCEKVFMGRGSVIGASSVVNYSGDLASEKYQSFSRARMRLGAEINGRNPIIAEKMVGCFKNGKFNVLTMTSKEAVNLGFCDGLYDSLSSMLESELEGLEIKVSSDFFLEKKENKKQKIFIYLTDTNFYKNLFLLISLIYFFYINIKLKTENKIIKSSFEKLIEYLKIKEK